MNSFLVDTLYAVLTIGSTAAATCTLELAARGSLQRATGVFYPVVAVLSGLVLFGLLGAALLFVLRRAVPLSEGEHLFRSVAFRRWKIHFNLQEAALRALLPFVPVTGRAWLFRLFGADIASPAVVAGLLTDPALTHLGKRVIVGSGALISCHLLVDGRFALRAVRVGDGVTIGGGSIVMAGVEIGDGAILTPGSVALAGTRIPAGELWTGNPARKMSASAIKPPRA